MKKGQTSLPTCLAHKAPSGGGAYVDLLPLNPWSMLGDVFADYLNVSFPKDVFEGGYQ